MLVVIIIRDYRDFGKIGVLVLRKFVYIIINNYNRNKDNSYDYYIF